MVLCLLMSMSSLRVMLNLWRTKDDFGGGCGNTNTVLGAMREGKVLHVGVSRPWFERQMKWGFWCFSLLSVKACLPVTFMVLRFLVLSLLYYMPLKNKQTLPQTWCACCFKRYQNRMRVCTDNPRKWEQIGLWIRGGIWAVSICCSRRRFWTATTLDCITSVEIISEAWLPRIWISADALFAKTQLPK